MTKDADDSFDLSRSTKRFRKMRAAGICVQCSGPSRKKADGTWMCTCVACALRNSKRAGNPGHRVEVRERRRLIEVELEAAREVVAAAHELFGYLIGNELGLDWSCHQRIVDALVSYDKTQKAAPCRSQRSIT